MWFKSSCCGSQANMTPSSPNQSFHCVPRTEYLILTPSHSFSPCCQAIVMKPLPNEALPVHKGKVQDATAEKGSVVNSKRPSSLFFFQTAFLGELKKWYRQFLNIFKLKKIIFLFNIVCSQSLWFVYGWISGNANNLIYRDFTHKVKDILLISFLARFRICNHLYLLIYT